MSRPTILGLLLGLTLYLGYVALFGREYSAKQTVLNTDSQIPQHGALSIGMDAEKSCRALQRRYNIPLSGPTTAHDVSVQYHWTFMHCTRVLKYEQLEKELIELRNKGASTTVPATAATVSVQETILQESAVPKPKLPADKPPDQPVWVQRSKNIAPIIVPSDQKAVDSADRNEDRVKMKDTLRCHRLQKRFGLKRGVDPATLPAPMYSEWTQMGCDVAIQRSNRGKIRPVVRAKDEDLHSDLSGRPWCEHTKSKFGVVPLMDWGRLPVTLQSAWKHDHHCDVVFSQTRMENRDIAKCPPTNTTALPLIAIMAATTTRRVQLPSPKTLSLFNFLLPSIMRSVDCNFRYVYILGYDVGDSYYDTDSGMREVLDWFKVHVTDVMHQHNIEFTIRPSRVNNSLKKPGPVFIEMARTAYNLGAEYFYRVNDDSEMVTNWPTLFVEALKSLRPPFGVVGPNCRQGNQEILTHDFVHRTHMEIFDMNYYPPELTDWWMDDWISFVYGRHRSFKAHKVEIMHHTGAHGTRYEVNFANEGKLDNLIKAGRNKIREWMLKNNIVSAKLNEFDSDQSRKFRHKDISY